MTPAPGQPIDRNTLTWVSLALGASTTAFLPVPYLVGIATTGSYVHIVSVSAAFFSAALIGGRLRRPVLAAHIIMVAMTLSIAVSAWLYGGLRPWLVIAFPLAPIAGGALLGRRAAMQYTVATLAVLGCIAPLQLAGCIPPLQTLPQLDIINTAVTAAMGCILAAAITWRWTTTIEERERSLAQARDAAVQADAFKTEFLANMSHEIRTPLNGVLGMAEVLLDGDLQARQREQVATIHRSGALLMRLLNDVLDLAKIEAGEVAIIHRPFAVHDLVNETMSVFADLAAKKGLELSCTIAKDVPHTGTSDEARIAQMLGNLLNNAIKFTDIGGVELTVTAPAPDRLSFTVRDTGVGMDADTLARAFDRFAQGASSQGSAIKGTGLGLAITHNLAQLLGGSISATSTPGEGSTFRFELPIRDADHARAPTDEPTGRARFGTTSTKRRRGRRAILVAEDDEVSGEVIVALLASLGYTDVTLATDGTTAVAACKNKSFALILMDGQMPTMDGFEATAAIRQLGVTDPIVGLTASALASDHRRCLDAGMNEVLTKPIGRRALQECLDTWLQGAS